MKLRRFLAVLMLASSPSIAAASEPPPSGEGASDGRTPPRLSYTNGQVSYWRPGAPDWVGAPLNIPLASGDELYTGPDGTLEIQVGPRAWVRAWAATSLGVVSHEPDYLQIKLTNGHATLDVRALDSGHTLEVATPAALFTVERPGYYRVSVTGERTAFTARRGGTATATPVSGQPTAVGASQTLVVEGGAEPAVALAAAADLDVWDQWNYARTDALAASVSARHVSPGVYGAADLDQHGTWQVVETYGNVWVPRGVPGGWAPYTTGSWIRDPYYGWTWVDTAPWGWAPYHYGRWVHARGFWAWAPGPVIVRPVYAPALVAFFAAPGVTVAIGGPVVAWCPLGWGEPIVPWWGRPGFAGVPSWRGWGGPRVVNNVVVRNTTVINAKNITVYSNSRVKDGIVAVRQDDFTGRRVVDHRVRPGDVRHMEPVAPAATATPASLVPAAPRAAVKPAPDLVDRQVIGSRRGPARAAPDDRADPGQAVRDVPRSPAPAGRSTPRQTEPVPSAVRPSPPQTAPAPPGDARTDRPGEPGVSGDKRAPARPPAATAPAPPPAKQRQTEPRQLGGTPPTPPPPAGYQPDQLRRQAPGGARADDGDPRVRPAPPAARQVRPPEQPRQARPAVTEPAPAPGRPTSQAIPLSLGGQRPLPQVEPAPTARPHSAPAAVRTEPRVSAPRAAEPPAAPAARIAPPRTSPAREPRAPEPAVRAPEPRPARQFMPQVRAPEPSPRQAGPAAPSRRAAEPEPNGDRGPRSGR